MDLESVLLPQDRQEPERYGKNTEALGYALPRPASYSYIPKPQDHDRLPFSFSEDDLVPTKPTWSENPRFESRDGAVGKEDLAYSSARNKPLTTSPNSRISVQRTAPVSDQLSQRREPSVQFHDLPLKHLHPLSPPREEQPRAATSDTAASAPRKAKTLSKTLSLARKSRTSITSSPSPETGPRDAANGLRYARARSSSPMVTEPPSTSDDSRPNPHINAENLSSSSLLRSKRTLSRRAKKSQTPSTKPPDAPTSQSTDSPKRPVTPLLKSWSNSNVPALTRFKDDKGNIPPLPATTPTAKLGFRGERDTKKKDELWSAFKALDADFSKFQSKSVSLKANVIRTNLIPFLRNFADHPSNAQLQPEHLDRRASILNKWWIGLLQLLQGNDYRNIPGIDRPVILDGISGIMTRAEWRQPPSIFSPVDERATANQTHPGLDHGRQSDSDSDDFLLESVHHNVRNMFVQCLFTQMDFVVDKMSQKHAPASLTSFCGNACAYAFLFCPGVAQVLVRHWRVSPTNMLKTLRAAGLPQGTMLKAFTDTVTVNFPPCLHSLAFTSVRGTSKSLNTSPVLPLHLEKLRLLDGHWLSRWCGRDGELFYTFVKCFHKLTLQFLPADTPVIERLRAPALVIVRAQMLSNLESAIQRQPAQENTTSEPGVTFDDFLNDDNPTRPLASSPLNAVRATSENRLVLLLKDAYLSPSTSSNQLAKFISESFCQILQAAARSTSLHNHDNCHHLCDFLQESLPILLRVRSDTVGPYQSADRAFWMNVLEQIARSEDVVIRSRLYVLVFNLWSSLEHLPEWRYELCGELLLTREHFVRTFCHWSPVVRVFYMRLLCWRLARYDGNASDNEIFVFQTLMRRLQETWSFYKYLDDFALERGALRPSTVPSAPMKGKWLKILGPDPSSGYTASPLPKMNDTFSASEDPGEDPLTADTSSSGPPTSVLERVTSTFEYGLDVARKRRSLWRYVTGARATETRDNPRPRSLIQDGDSSGQPLRGSPKASRSSSPDKPSSRASVYEHRPAETVNNRSRPGKSSASSLQPPWNRSADFMFCLCEATAEEKRNGPYNMPMDLTPPRLPAAAHVLLKSLPDFEADREACEPGTQYLPFLTYAGRALAEWSVAVTECQNFFECRLQQGVPSNRQVETPALNADQFRFRRPDSPPKVFPISPLRHVGLGNNDQ